MASYNHFLILLTICFIRASAETKSGEGKKLNISAYQQVALEVHNKHRLKHGVKPLVLNEVVRQQNSIMCQTWQQSLNRDALECAQYHVEQREQSVQLSICPYRKTSNYTDVGENHMSMSGPVPDNETDESVAQLAIDGWYNESIINDYDYSKDDFEYDYFMKIGHFTQVVWKKSRELGVGIAHAPNRSELTVFVALYFPGGNVMYRFRDNVLSPDGHASCGYSIQNLGLLLMIELILPFFIK